MVDWKKIAGRPSTGRLVALFVAVLTISHVGDVLNPGNMLSLTYNWTAVDKHATTVDGMDLLSWTEDVPTGPAKDVESLFQQFHEQIEEQKQQLKSTPKPAPKPPPPRPQVERTLAPWIVPLASTTQEGPTTSRGPRPAPPPPSFNFSITEPNDRCTDNTEPAANVTAVFSDFARQVSMVDLMEVMQAGVNPGDLSYRGRHIAMCKLRRYGNYAHFPHMMQQFTRCFSFWQIYNSYEPYLYMYTHIHAYRRGEDEFNQGMFRLFRQVFNVKIVFDLDKVDGNTLLVKPLYDVGMDESLQQGIVFQNEQHATVFRESAQNYYNITPAGCQAGKTEPVIRILNREANSTRTIVNVKTLQKYLRKFTSHPVQIYTFENRTFKQQMTFMSQTDILVTPHGAQMSSIAFIPACGGVFEIFPEGFFMPHFFGPLAATSGLRHAYVYNGDDVNEEWYNGNKLYRPGRFAARRRDVCVPLHTSLELIGRMVDEWKVCCQERAAQGLVGRG